MVNNDLYKKRENLLHVWVADIWRS